MTKSRKIVLGILVALVLVAVAAFGIWGWEHQFRRSPVAKSVATQPTPDSIRQLPISVRPLLR